MSEIFDYKCPNCNASLEFDSASQKMKCPYCESMFEVETLKQMDESLNKTSQPDSFEWENTEKEEWNGTEEDNMSVFVCKFCGGEIISDENTAATACPYCGNNVVLSGRLSGVLKPDYVIPFKFDKKAAKDKLKQYVASKKFAPNTFKSENRLDEIKGLYVPFWLFEANAEAQIKYDATRIRMYSDARYNYIETSHYLVHRAGTLKFADVPVDGSSQMPDDLMESVEPFDTSKAKPFSTDYLAGFLANRYDVSKEKSINRANDRIKRSTEEEFAETVGAYAEAHPISSNIQLYNGKARYALYPVWILTTSWNGENYIFAMNGQTGKFVGNLPVDTKAAAVWLITRGLLISLIIYAVIFLLHLISII